MILNSLCPTYWGGGLYNYKLESPVKQDQKQVVMNKVF